MKLDFMMTVDGKSIKSIRPFLKENIKTNGIVDFKLVESSDVVQMITDQEITRKTKIQK